jgi:DNA-binding response OmpR family regulator
MDTNRKHGVKEPPPQRARGGARGTIEDLAHRFWSGRALNQATVEATRAAVMLDRDFIPGSMLPPRPAKARCGDLEVDRVARRAALAGSDLRLTGREFAVLLCLLDRINRVVPRSDLLEKIWTLPDDRGSNVVDVYIRRLRQKFGAHAGMIETIRGFGYCLRPAMGA